MIIPILGQSPYQKKYTYREDFNDPALSQWVKIDTGGRISVAGGSVDWSAGVGADGDPAIFLRVPRNRTNLALLTKVKISAGLTSALRIGFTNNPTGESASDAEYLFYVESGDKLALRRGPSVGDVLITPIDITPTAYFWLWLFALPTGALFYWSTDNLTFTPAGYSSTGVITPLHPALWSPTRALTADFVDGPLRQVPSPLSSIDTPTGVTPTLAGTITANGTMEADSSWNNYLTPTTNERSNTQAHTGTYSRHIIADSTNDGIESTPDVTTVTGAWYAIQGWHYPTSRTDVRIGRRKGSGAEIYITEGVSGLTLNAWNLWQYCIREDAGGAGARISIRSRSGADEFYSDDILWQPITFATMFDGTYTREANSEVSFLVSNLTAGTQAGMAIKYVDDDNCLICYHDGTTAFVIEYAAGVYGLVASQAVAYNAATLFSCKSQDGKLRVYYGTQAVGAELTENAAYKDATEMKLFSTLATNRVNTMKCWGSVTV